ncbi:ABC transporter permease [Clostridium botulinum]|nr:ABC transporter permease [Clostridium botulinum]MCS4482802.1 ABC transporter permease [Clostridium botulinum]
MAFMILLIFMASFFLSGLAYFISLSLPNEVIYETIMTAIILPIFFLSTALFPLENLSGCLAIAVKLNPFTYIISALRSLIFGESLCFGTFCLSYCYLQCCAVLALHWQYGDSKKKLPSN